MYNVLPTGRKTKSEPQTTQTYMPSNHMSQDIATIENMHATYNFGCLLRTAHQSLRAFCRHAASFVCFGDHFGTNKGAVISIGHPDFKTFDANVFWGIIVSNCVTIFWNISHACLECVFVQYFVHAWSFTWRTQLRPLHICVRSAEPSAVPCCGDVTWRASDVAKTWRNSRCCTCCCHVWVMRILQGQTSTYCDQLPCDQIWDQFWIYSNMEHKIMYI